MEKKLFENYSQIERIEMFEANADKVEERTYFEELSDNELIEKKSKFAQISIELAKLEDEKKAEMDKFKTKMKPIQKESSGLLNEIKTGHAEKYGKVYKMIDHETRMVGYYSEAGNLVEKRPATEDESRQLTIASSRRKVANQ